MHRLPIQDRGLDRRAGMTISRILSGLAAATPWCAHVPRCALREAKWNTAWRLRLEVLGAPWLGLDEIEEIAVNDELGRLSVGSNLLAKRNQRHFDFSIEVNEKAGPHVQVTNDDDTHELPFSPQYWVGQYRRNSAKTSSCRIAPAAGRPRCMSELIFAPVSEMADSVL